MAQFCARYSVPYSAKRSGSVNQTDVRYPPGEIAHILPRSEITSCDPGDIEHSCSERSTATWYALKRTDEAIMNNTTAVKDPVCGMDVEIATSAGRTEHNGQTYYFCGLGCKAKFDLNPEQYSGKTAGRPQSGHSCCS